MSKESTMSCDSTLKLENMNINTFSFIISKKKKHVTKKEITFTVPDHILLTVF